LKGLERMKDGEEGEVGVEGRTGGELNKEEREEFRKT